MRLLLYPGHTLPTAAAPVLVSAGLALHDGVFAPVPLLLALVGSWCIHVAGVFADNHELLRRHPGVPEHPELQAALADGTLTLRELRRGIYVCLVLAVLAGIYPLVLGGVPALLLGVVGVLSSLGYACGPRPYAKSGLADPFFFLMFGVVAVAGAYYIQAVASRDGWTWRDVPVLAYLIGLPVGCLVTNVLIIDDIRDRHFDRDKGWRTGAVRFGLGWSRAEHLALALLAYLLPVWFWLGLGLTPLVLLPLLTAPMAMRIAAAVRQGDTTADLRWATPHASFLSMLYAALLGLGLALS